jgi:uncharacterized protein (DUF1501 family)
MLHVGAGSLPLALRGRRSLASALTRPEDFVLAPEAQGGSGGEGEEKDDLLAYVRRMAVESRATARRMKDLAAHSSGGAAYPANQLGEHLRLIARLIQADTGARVYYTSQGGYDTHAAQFGQHYQLLTALSEGVKAFLDDLASAKLADRVLVLAFSEFGRTVKENGSAGTDHGTAGPVFLAGAKVKAGLVGKAPSLTELDPRHGDLKVQHDFRRVYATVLADWLGLPAEAVGKDYERMALLRT